MIRILNQKAGGLIVHAEAIVNSAIHINGNVTVEGKPGQDLSSEMVRSILKQANPPEDLK